MARLEAMAGELATARARSAASLRLRVRMGDRFGVAQNLEAEAGLLSLQRDPAAGVRLLGAAATLRQQAEGPAWPVDQQRISGVIAALRSVVDDFDPLWAEGAALARPDRPLADIVSDLFVQAALGAA